MNDVLSGNSVSYFFPSLILTSYQLIRLFICLFVNLYALNYCIYVYIEGLMED